MEFRTINILAVVVSAVAHRKRESLANVACDGGDSKGVGIKTSHTPATYLSCQTRNYSAGAPAV